MHAAELPRIDLGDALAICLVFLAHEPHAYDRAATRWLGRLCLERPIGVRDAQLAAAALDALGRGADEGAHALRVLCERLNLEQAARWLDHWLGRPRG
jgi:hypothetical protein